MSSTCHAQEYQVTSIKYHKLTLFELFDDYHNIFRIYKALQIKLTSLQRQLKASWICIFYPKITYSPQSIMQYHLTRGLR